MFERGCHGNCIVPYCLGKDWGEHLPTDSALVTHIFCCYMDSRLPPHPRHPDGRTFTNQYFVKAPEKPRLEKDSLQLYQTKTHPPHFKVRLIVLLSNLSLVEIYVRIFVYFLGGDW